MNMEHQVREQTYLWRRWVVATARQNQKKPAINEIKVSDELGSDESYSSGLHKRQKWFSFGIIFHSTVRVKDCKLVIN
jgi:hypothetical protein